MRNPKVKSASLAAARPEQVGLSSARLARIGVALDREIAQGRLPGAVVLVARRGRIAYWEAFGRRDPAQPAPMRRDDVFRVYSMTKPIVSVAAMMLHEEGRFALNDPISRFFPAFAKLTVAVARPGGAQGPQALEAAERPITIQDLLRHTAGLTYGFRDTHLKAVYEQAEQGISTLTNREVVERLGSLPLAFQPGTVWEYSRATDVLGALVELISNRSLGEFLAERILQPLGMKDTGFWLPEQHWARLAEPGPDPETGKPQPVVDVKHQPAFESGGGGLVSTAQDYIRFAQVLLGGGQLDGTRLLGPKTVAWMTSDHLGAISRGREYIPGQGYGFGLGFAVRESAGLSPMLGTAGDYTWSGAAGTYFWVDPAEQLIGIMMIQAPSLRMYYRHLIRTLVLQALME
jgi:CubicO group peptidase (beta-lactamase class C family)